MTAIVKYTLIGKLKNSQRMNRQLADKLYDTLRLYTPVKTGNMRRNWDIRNYNSKSFTLENDTFYLPFVDQGTLHISPRYFVRKAMNRFDRLATKILGVDIDTLYRKEYIV